MRSVWLPAFLGAVVLGLCLADPVSAQPRRGGSCSGYYAVGPSGYYVVPKYYSAAGPGSSVQVTRSYYYAPGESPSIEPGSTYVSVSYYYPGGNSGPRIQSLADGSPYNPGPPGFIFTPGP
jgi:hypothetical protein